MNNSNIQKALQSTSKIQPYEWIYSTHCFVMFGLNSILLLLSAYQLKSIIKKATYDIKPFVFHCILSCWLMMAILNLTQPVSLPGIYGNYSIGVFKYLDQYWMSIDLWIGLSCFLHIAFIFTIALMIQYNRLHITSLFPRLFYYLNTSENIWKIFNFSLIFHFILIGLPVLIGYYLSENVDEIKEVREFRAKNPSLFILSIEHNYLYNLMLEFIGMIVFAEVFFSIIISIYTLIQIQKTSKNVSQKTLKLQLAIFELYLSLIFIIFLFFYVPTLFSLISKLFVMDQIYTIPLIICAISWFYPTSFIVSLIQLVLIRRRFGDSTPRTSV